MIALLCIAIIFILEKIVLFKNCRKLQSDRGLSADRIVGPIA